MTNPDIPPIDPDLMRRLRAASDERGVIQEEALANEYFEALQKQEQQVREAQGIPEPVIESGSVFPSAPGLGLEDGQ